MKKTVRAGSQDGWRAWKDGYGRWLERIKLLIGTKIIPEFQSRPWIIIDFRPRSAISGLSRDLSLPFNLAVP